MVHLDKGVFHAEELTEAGTLIGRVRRGE
jgi:hypothetical protein